MYFSPSLTRFCGCSLTDDVGTTHDTAGSEPFCAAPTKLVIDWMLPSWSLSWTVSNFRSGLK